MQERRIHTTGLSGKDPFTSRLSNIAKEVGKASLGPLGTRMVREIKKDPSRFKDTKLAKKVSVKKKQ